MLLLCLESEVGIVSKEEADGSGFRRGDTRAGILKVQNKISLTTCTAKNDMYQRKLTRLTSHTELRLLCLAKWN